jgi:signal transduction histidine kinase
VKLSDFIREHSDQILATWDEFAATVEHSGKPLDHKALRDHAGQILMAIAADLEQPQSGAQQIAKSRGEAVREEGDVTAAETHADTRIEAGFAIDAMLTEYRALRASVLRLWAESKSKETHAGELEQLMRFNEAVDQAISESVARYTEQVQRYTNLFMGMLGHDIRNPLGTISMSAELLVRSGQLQRKAVDPIINGARRIQGIVELVVDFSRAQSNGVMPITPKPFNLLTIFESVLAETQVRHPNTELVLKAEGELDGEWDEGRVAQLLSNLLENAISYGARGRPVAVKLNGDGSTVTLSVHNFGAVIPLEDRERIFEPRSRGSLADERKAPNGLGLGLYICREITRAHNGTLSVRSTAEDGTTQAARRAARAVSRACSVIAPFRRGADATASRRTAPARCCAQAARTRCPCPRGKPAAPRGRRTSRAR